MPCGMGPLCVWCWCGGVLLSHTPWGAVPSALSGLASRFEKVCWAFPRRYDHRKSLIVSIPPPPFSLFLSLFVPDKGGGGWVGCFSYSGCKQCVLIPLPRGRVRPKLGVRVVFSVGLLVPVGSHTRYRASTSGLSTQWSTGGLHTPRRGVVETSSWSRLPKREKQHFLSMRE